MTGLAWAQESEDKTKLFGGFSHVSLDYGTATVRGLNVSAQVKIAGSRGVRLEVVGDSTFLFEGGDLLQSHQAGPQVGLDLLGGGITPFARTMFGASLYEGSRSYTHSTGVGIDVALGKGSFFRGTYDRVDIRGIPPFYRTTVGVGIAF